MYEIKQIGTSHEGHPIFCIGYLSYNGPAVMVTAVISSRENGMRKVGGWYVALTTAPALTWEKARALRVCGEDLIVVFRKNEPQILQVLFNGGGESLHDLVCTSGGDSKFTTENPDIHAHIFVAPKSVWEQGTVRRMVDDARTPVTIAHEATEKANASYDERVLNSLNLIQEGLGSPMPPEETELIHAQQAGAILNPSAKPSRTPPVNTAILPVLTNIVDRKNHPEDDIDKRAQMYGYGAKA